MPAETQQATSRRMDFEMAMKARQWITASVLLLLVAAAIVGIVWTREPAAVSEDSPTPTNKTLLGRKKGSTQRPLVDQRPLLTAKRMTALASTPEEQALAHEAEKVGDHEVDLAFFDALRTAEENPPALSPESKQIAQR